MSLRALRIVPGAALVLGAAALSSCAPTPEEGDEPSLSVQETLGGMAQEGFLRATEPPDFSFPEDHGAHPGYRNEWWYFTGNLETPEGDPVGYQLTLFRTELAPPPEDEARLPGVDGSAPPPAGRAPADRASTDSVEPSAWRTRVAWMGHLAVTDGGRGIHREAERFVRGSVGLAGVRPAPLRVWMEDWEVELLEDEPSDAAALGPLRLAAAEGDLGIELVLEARRPPVPQGDRGLSQKGPEPGNASLYYSIPRLATRGRVTVDGRTLEVEGESWLDREWSTSALSPGVVGWDWFALRLSDGWDVMVYNLRREDGSVTEFSKGVLMGPDGEKVDLQAGEMELDVRDWWESPLDGARYPSGWELRVPGHDLVLAIDPLIREQEMDLAFRYWEGAVTVEGRRMGEGIEGAGYVELTGYAGAVPGER